MSEALREMRWAQVVLELALLVLGILIALPVPPEPHRSAIPGRDYDTAAAACGSSGP